MEYLRHHIQIMTGQYFDDTRHVAYDVFWTGSSGLKDMEWNFAWGELPLLATEKDQVFTQITALAKKLRRKPVLYTFCNESDSRLAPGTREIWMDLTKPDLNERPPLNDFTLTKVECQDDIQEFLKIYADAFSLEGKNPYLIRLEKLLHSGSLRQSHFLGKRAGQAMCCATLARLQDLAGLYNVGTPQRFQGMGLGWQITQAVCHKAFALGTQKIYLQTEQGSTVEKFYSRMGFKTAQSGYFRSVLP